MSNDPELSPEEYRPGPFSARRAQDFEPAGDEDGPVPPHRLGGPSPTPSEEISESQPDSGDQGDGLPWLVTRDEAGDQPPRPGADADSSGTASEELEVTSSEALPAWLDMDLDEEEVGDPIAEDPWTSGRSEQVEPTLAESRPDPSPPLGTSALVGTPEGEDSQPGKPGWQPGEPAHMEPEVVTEEAGGVADAHLREKAAARLSDLADWLRDADLDETLMSADDEGFRLFLAGVVLGRSISSRGA